MSVSLSGYLGYGHRMQELRCANPDCPEPPVLGRLTNDWVQVEQYSLAGSHIGEGPVRRPFAAVTCSKRCAAAVLVAAAEADDAAARQQKETQQRSYETADPFS